MYKPDGLQRRLGKPSLLPYRVAPIDLCTYVSRVLLSINFSQNRTMLICLRYRPYVSRLTILKKHASIQTKRLHGVNTQRIIYTWSEFLNFIKYTSNNRRNSVFILKKKKKWKNLDSQPHKKAYSNFTTFSYYDVYLTRIGVNRSASNNQARQRLTG